MFQVEHFLATKNELGESPLWSKEEGALYWVDIEGEKFHRYTVTADKIDTFSVGQPIGCLAIRENGGLIMALRDGIGFWDWGNQKIELIVNSEDDRQGVRFNDGKVDSQGRFWAGTMGVDDKNKLFRLDPDLTFHVMETGVTISNGIGWSPDDKVMYYTDSPLRVIYAYDFDSDTGSIENRREFVRVPLSDGFPDGLAVDSQGFIWSAQWDGWKVVRYDPDGNIERTIPVPVQRPTSCAFGGATLDQLFITSARTGLNEAVLREQLLAGDLFLCSTDIPGQPTYNFRG